ncbi:hypothetical protein BDB01DRAFT_831513 [Pilobolus umbonatus]|nr:hypothetical protein BDB01DRAFT_831513 [Pilobolus umbonatus]
MTKDTQTMLAWLQKELSIYADLKLIPPITSLSVDTWSGKVLITLAHRFFPEAVTDLPAQLQSADAYSFASTVFKDQLNIELPETTDNKAVTDCLSAVYEAMVETKNDDMRDIAVGNADLFEKQAIGLLSQLNQLNNQLMELTNLSSRDSVSTNTQLSYSRAPSPFTPRIVAPDDTNSTTSSNNDMKSILTNEEDDPRPSRSLLLPHQEEPMTLEDIESHIKYLEQHDIQQFKSLVARLPSHQRTHHDLISRLSFIDATHAAITMQLQKGDAFRNTIFFTSTLSHIRNELEFIQAKMLKTTTTDAGIQDLESRAQRAGKLISDMTIQFKELLHTNESSDESYHYQLETIVHKYKLVCTWVDDVRVWFVEAERIRNSMEDIMKTLESKQPIDALHDVELEYSLDQVNDLNLEHRKLEKQIESFNKEDMARLRAHVKALTGTERGNKELSPADTTTIEITFTTLMTLDKLQHLLRRRSYELQMLTNRLYWEQEYNKTTAWIRSTGDMLRDFVQHQARWRPSNDVQLNTKESIIDILIEFEKQANLFDQGQFTTTVNLYQDLDDNCNTELPMHLESRQVAVEEAFEELKNRIAFARLVVEQYLALTDFIDKADRLKNEGEQLRQDINHAEDNGIPGKEKDFNEQVTLFQEHAIRLITHVAARIPYPEAIHPLDQQGNDEANEVIHMVVGKSKSALRLLGEALEQSLVSHKRIIQLQKRTKQIQDEISRLNGLIEERMRSIKKAKIDIFVGKCALDETDLARLKKERNGQMSKWKTIAENDISKLYTHIQQLEALCQSNNISTTHTLFTSIASLHAGMENIESKLSKLKDVLEIHSLNLDILSLRITWESQHMRTSQWISSMIFSYWEFIANKAQWRPDYFYQMEECDHPHNDNSQLNHTMEEFIDMKNKVDEFYQLQFKPVDAVYVELVDGFKQIMAKQSPEYKHHDENGITPEHVQRRQDALRQSATNLLDLQEFTEQVMKQKEAFIKFFNQGSGLKGEGHRTLQDIQLAIKTVESEKLDYHRTKVKEFSQDVFELWVNSGSTLPYPQCNEDARATRPSTVDDEISTEISSVVFKIYADLQELVRRMHELLQKLGLAVQYKMELSDCCSDILTMNGEIQSFVTEILEHKFDLHSSVFPLPSVDKDSLNVHKANKSSYSKRFADIKSVKMEGIKTRLSNLKQTITDSNCDTVDQTVVDQPMIDLAKSIVYLGQCCHLYTTQVEVSESRLLWQELILTNDSTLQIVYNNIRDMINEKNVWISRDAVEHQDSSLSVLFNRLKAQNEWMIGYSAKDMPHLKHAFKEMGDNYQGLKNLTGIDINSVLIDRQTEIERLLNKTKDLLALQISEVQYLLTRYDWECRADKELRNCLDIESYMENIIETTARWSATDSKDTVNSDKVELALLSGINQKVELQVTPIQNLLLEIGKLQASSIKEHNSLLSTEAIFRRKLSLESAIDRIRNHASFVDEVFSQKKSMIYYLDKMSELENVAETMKAHIMAADIKNSQQNIDYNQYKSDVASIVKEVNKQMLYPVRHFINHDPHSRENDITHNATLREIIQSREFRLDDLTHTLESLIKSKERSSRRRGAEESYMSDAAAVRDWIRSKSDSVDSLSETLTMKSVDIDKLRADVTMAGAVQSAVLAYTSSINSLKESANKYICMIEQYTDGADDDATENIHRIQFNKLQVNAAWDELKEKAWRIKVNLSTLLRRTEFYNLVDSYHTSSDQMKHIMMDNDIKDVNEEMTLQWQSKVPLLETQFIDQIKTRLSEEKIKCEQQEGTSEKELKAMNKVVCDIVENYNELKWLMNQRITEINHHRLKNKYFTGAEAMLNTINMMKQSLEDMKCSQGTLHGDSKEDDEQSLANLRTVYDSICSEFDNNTEKYDEQRSFHRFLQLNEVPNLQKANETQKKLDQDWKELKVTLSNDKNFVGNISQWFDLHKQISKMHNDALSSIKTRLDAFGSIGHDDTDVPLFFAEDKASLNELVINSQALLKTANELSVGTYSTNEIVKNNLRYFTVKYEAYEKSMSQVLSILKAKMNRAQKEVAFKHARHLIAEFENSVQHEVELVQRRILSVSSIDVSENNKSKMEQIYRKVVGDLHLAEGKEENLNSRDMASIQRCIDSIKSEYTDNQSLKLIQEIEEEVDGSRKSFRQYITTEKELHDLFRKVLGHFKSAEGIHQWVDNCKSAIQNVYSTTENAVDDNEAEQTTISLEQKIDDFEKFVISFREKLLEIKSVEIPLQNESLKKYQEPAYDTLMALTDHCSMLIEGKWESMQQEMQAAKSFVQKNTLGVLIARKMKKIMSSLGDTRDFVNDLKLIGTDMTDSCSVTVTEVSDSYTEYEDDLSSHQDVVTNEDDQLITHKILSSDSIDDTESAEQSSSNEMESGSLSDPKYSLYSQFTSLLREEEVERIQKSLVAVEKEIKPYVQQELESLDAMILEYEDTDEVFDRQHTEIKSAVSNLYGLISDKYAEIEKSLDMGRYLKHADEYEMIHNYIEVAINKSALHHATLIGSNFSRSDLYSRLFELEAHYSCYEPRITQCLVEAKLEAANIQGQKESTLIKLHLEEMENKWIVLKKQFKARQAELNRTIETAVDQKEQPVRLRKSSLPTRKANSLLRDRGDVLLARQQSAMSRLSPTSSNTSNSRSSSTASSRLGRSSSSSLQSPASRNAGSRYLTPPLPAGSQNHQPSKSASSLKTKPRVSVSKAPPNSYVPDPHNMLDMEIGRIVNETPYRVKVKMVPGETGRYWFGDTNPKLAYCRVLKSKMVMVRVGGGWTELSQFLRDHALLDGDFIPRNRTNMIPEEDEDPRSPEIQDGFIETRRAQLPSGKLMPIPRSASPNRHQQHPPLQHRPSSSNNLSTPLNPMGSLSQNSASQAGYKDGDKFIAIDQNGNQMEVKMRRVSGDITDMERKSKASNDYTRRRLAKRKEKPSPPPIN